MFNPKEFLRRHVPAPLHLREHPRLQWLGDRLHDPEIWHFGRRSVASATGIGLFLAMIPLPIQMISGLAACLLLRINIPVMFAAICVTNPITTPPVLYFAFQLGALLTGAPAGNFHFRPDEANLSHLFQDVVTPLMVGCLITGLLAGLAGYLAVLGLWRLHLVRRWQGRRRA